MSGVPKCTSWLGHRFEARYSAAAPTIDRQTLLFIYGTDERLRAIRESAPRTYEGDVCTRCGAVVNRREKAGAETSEIVEKPSETT